MSVSPESRLDSFPEPWRPEPGDKLIGVVVALDQRDTEFGTYPIVTTLTDDGAEISFHAFHTVAARELATLRPQVGERIGIAYHGRGVDRHGNEGRYERYRIVMLDRAITPPKTPDWDAVAASASASDDGSPSARPAEPEPSDPDIPF